MDPSIAGMQQYGTAVKEMLPKQICQAFFLIAASAVLFLNSIPAFRQRFISYGSRISSKPHTTSVNDSQPSKARETVIDKKSATSVVSQFLDYISTFQVPHSWFTHFYVLSVLSSIFWAVQIAIRGRFLELIVDGQAAHDDENEGIMTANQIFIAWLFMTIQGSRRLYESIVFGKPSKSRMWVVHWVLGLLYYAAMGVAIWIEGSGTLKNTEPLHQRLSFTGFPSIKSIIAFPLFVFASGIQHDSHFYLSALKKYTLPQDLLFGQIVCPHYTMECLIYLSLAIVAAPQGHVFNKAIFCGLVFVAVNLGVTAQITKEWYAEKFGKDTVERKWVIFPLIY